jgi:4-hydroxy-tetrahydrodipicolinate synthase
MMPTPFNDKSEIDYDSIDKLIELSIKSKCYGIVIMGVMGEAHRLTENERNDVIKHVSKIVNGRIPITVGVSGESIEIVSQRVKESNIFGANYILCSPPKMLKTNESVLLEFFKGITKDNHLPIVLQDLPQETGVNLTPEFINKISTQVPQIKFIKLEDPPTPKKISEILSKTSNKLGIFGGLGGIFLIEELMRGAIGTMTGFAYPEILVNTFEEFKKNNINNAKSLFYKWLPLIRYENQQGISLSIRKHILFRRGIISTPDTRLPTPSIDEKTEKELEFLLKDYQINN